MKIISFAWTTPALLAGAKTVTRRDWDDDYARRFTLGQEVLAYNRSPRHKGQAVARLRIVSVTKEWDRDAPDDDYEAEGFAWMEAHPESLPKADRGFYLGRVSRDAYDQWRRGSGWSWVCRFEVLEVLA